MNKTIIININSIVFHIEEEAYEVLRSYMIEIKRHFSQSEDSHEILLDIENRIAEMFSERIQQGKKEVISNQDVQDVIAQMGRVSDFEEVDSMDDSRSFEEVKEDTTSRQYTDKKLMRNPDDKVLGGVCSGLGYFFGIQTKWVRVLFVLFFLFGGSGVLLYIVLWIVMPLASSRADRMAMKGEEPNLQNFKKSFEEELSSYKDDFSKAQNGITDGAKAVGESVVSFVNLIVKCIAFLLLIFCGMIVFSMLGALIGFGSAILGFQNEMVFPGLEVLSQGQALIALAAGVFAITIPFLALFNLLVRVLFKTRPMNNYLSLSLWATWIVSILLVVFFTFLGIREFKEESIIKVDKPITHQDVYYFSEKNIRVIDGETLGAGNKIMKIEVDGDNLSAYLKKDINIRFESLSDGDQPYIQYNYYAKGKTYQSATKRASDINYLAIQDKNKIVFDSHFSLGKNNEYRDQSVTAVVYLPIGNKVVIDNSLKSKVRGISYWNCLNQYSDEDVKATEWVMTKTGLSCLPNFLADDQNMEEYDDALDLL